MEVRHVMTHAVSLARPDQTIQDAAMLMMETDSGSLPVGDGDRLVGMLTDRDIVIRALALGKGPDTPVRDVMTDQVMYCFEDQDVREIAQNMADQQVRRLPVVNRNKRLVGIVSLADLAVYQTEAAAEAIAGVSQPGGPRSQGMSN
jgi:CBS domain-containing protein